MAPTKVQPLRNEKPPAKRHPFVQPPDTFRYKVQTGDTWVTLAKRYDHYQWFDAGHLIYNWQRLRQPGAHAARVHALLRQAASGAAPAVAVRRALCCIEESICAVSARIPGFLRHCQTVVDIVAPPDTLSGRASPGSWSKCSSSARSQRPTAPQAPEEVHVIQSSSEGSPQFKHDSSPWSRPFPGADAGGAPLSVRTVERELPDVTGFLVVVLVTLGLFVVPVGATLMQGPAIVASLFSR